MWYYYYGGPNGVQGMGIGRVAGHYIWCVKVEKKAARIRVLSHIMSILLVFIELVIGPLA